MPGVSADTHLLPLLRDSRHVLHMSLNDWDSTLRLARQSRLLGHIAHRLEADPVLWARVPSPVQGHLRSALIYAEHRVKMVQLELDALASAVPPSVQLVLLKGAAYVVEGLSFAKGRLPGDVDIMVSRAMLDRVESALLDAGWKFENVDPYDQQYYRQWSHELPPMRYPGHAMEVDLHHTITPVTSRARADDGLLFGALRPSAASRYKLLSPLDQIVHAVIHLFQDSELDGRLRDLVDIDCLLRLHMKADVDWSMLATRAEQHSASRLLWYALHYCHAWLGTPVHQFVDPPPAATSVLMDWLVSATMLPQCADEGVGAKRRLGRLIAQARYHWLRMPPALLARHMVAKGWRQLRVVMGMRSS